MKIFEGSDASEFFQADDWTTTDELAARFMAARIAAPAPEGGRGMTGMPERLFAWKNSRGRISVETKRRSDGQSEFIRADMVGSKDAEIARLRVLLR